MVIDGSMKIIDFQGARIGPWGYDLASLLYDPYTDLPEGVRRELLGLYLSRYMPQSSCNREKMLQAFYVTALLRTLQVLGAFSFLSREKGKEFFSAYIHPALHNMQTLLAGKYFKRMRNLHTLLRSITDR
jgi:aminoglycoside/choline kinase family phosphotransferase